MTAEVLGEIYDQKHDRIYLLVTGLGAFALLKDETGIHQIDHRFMERTPRAGHESKRQDRELVRVEVLPVGGEPDKPFTKAIKTKISPLKPPRNRLLPKAEWIVSLFHEPTLRSWKFGWRAHVSRLSTGPLWFCTLKSPLAIPE